MSVSAVHNDSNMRPRIASYNDNLKSDNVDKDTASGINLKDLFY